jgi:hypothetical protein
MVSKLLAPVVGPLLAGLVHGNLKTCEHAAHTDSGWSWLLNSNSAVQ